MPGPVSVTETTKWPLRAPAAMLTSPASVNLMALPTRLSSTCVRRCSSPRPMGRGLFTDVVSVSFLFWASYPLPDIAFCTLGEGEGSRAAAFGAAGLPAVAGGKDCPRSAAPLVGQPQQAPTANSEAFASPPFVEPPGG